MTIDDIDVRLARAGRDLACATANRDAVVAECRQLAVDGYAAGMTEVRLAELLGVDRANTIRRWLGK